MITIKQSVENSISFLKDMYPESNSFQDILLEEAEFSDDKKFWFITIGFDRLKKNEKSALLRTIEITPSFHREYKIFKVDANSGEVISMKIRKDESAIA